MVALSPFSLERMICAPKKVRGRLLRTTAALNEAEIEYAIAGGNAVAFWVARVDEAGIRNTPNIDILIRHADLPAVIEVLEQAGFIYRNVHGADMFLDGPDTSARDAVHIIFAGEKASPQELLPNPDVSAFELVDGFRVLALKSLVQIKLTAFQDKDRVHLRDMLDVELIDATWVLKYPAELGERLQLLIDTPEGHFG